MPVFQTHDVVENGIKRGTEIVEEARDMEKIFVNSTEEFILFEVYKCKALCMEWSPADEESNNNRCWN